jgi:SAM-dependent methyltransferase
MEQVAPGDGQAHRSFIATTLRRHPEFKDKLLGLLRAIGYDTTHWMRVVFYRRAVEFIRSLGPEKLDVMEISGGPHWKDLPFKTYLSTEYPDFDITTQTLSQKFDLIIADQIFEHLRWPVPAARNVYAMLKPGGTFIIGTPFLVRFHAVPIDCNRWTEEGMSCLLQGAGFPADHIKTDSWGNRACVKANLDKWAPRGFALFGSLKNEPEFPVQVWAFARRPLDG